MSARDVVDPVATLAHVRRFKRRRELFDAVCDLDMLTDGAGGLRAWLREYVRRPPEPTNPRTIEARRWLADLEGGP